MADSKEKMFFETLGNTYSKYLDQLDTAYNNSNVLYHYINWHDRTTQADDPIDPVIDTEE